MQAAASSRTGPSIDGHAEIVRATKVSTAQASPITHYRSRSRSSNSAFSTEGSPLLAAAAIASGSARVMPSPIPPPCAALPPTPGVAAGAGSPVLGGSAILYRGNRSNRNSVLSRSSLRNKNFRHLNVGLTHEEHSELVQKILADLRPASHVSTTTVTTGHSSSRSLSPATKTASAAHERLAAANKMCSRSDDDKRLSASSQSTDASQLDSGVVSSNNKLSASTTPQLSQSRTPTPTTPVETETAAVKADQPDAEADKALMTPTAALESLRVLENAFQRSSIHLPNEDGSTTQDSKLSSPTTAVAVSPTRSTMSDNEVATPRSKRSSSYRKSVPALSQLHEGVDALGISTGGQKDAPHSPTSDHSSSVTAETPSWISSLSALEAIRVLAFQQDVAQALAHPEGNAAKSAVAAAAEAAVSADEVSALRYALKFAIARADRLAEALHRVNEDKAKVECELEVLRRNVLSMLGSKDMFGSGAAEAPVRRAGRRRAVEDELVVEEEDAMEQFEDAQSAQSHVAPAEEQATRRKPQQKQQQQQSDAQPRSNASAKTRPTRAAHAAPATQTASAKPAAPAAPAPSKGVSIASLRAKNASSSAATAASQRYAPSRKDRDAATTSSSSSDEDEEDEEAEEDFDLFPFNKPTRRIAPEVSMTDFLNASRMSKIEIEQHDARRELERSLADDADGSSTNSRAPLTGGGAAGFVNPRGLFKSLTKMVDQRVGGRRSSAFLAPPVPDKARLNRSPSASLVQQQQQLAEPLSFDGDSIIPQYPGSVGRKPTALPKRVQSHSSSSLNTSLRESLEKHSLRDAGIRT